MEEVRSMTNTLEDEVRRIVASMDNEQSSQEQEQPEPTEQEPQPIDTIHIHYFPDAIVIVKEEENTAQVVDSTPVISQKVSFLPAYAICSCYLFLILSCIAFQVYLIFNPPIATITIIPKSQQVTLNGTLQLGRLLQPITISQTSTTATTGRGHQDAKAATGYITFYNGQFQSVIVAAGTILTGADGVQIVTDQEAVIPAGNPPSYGQITVSAHAINPGRKGNIPAYDINEACCAQSVLVKNIIPFTDGQDERNFQTVAKHDIASIATPLKATVMQSMRGALQGQVQPQEQLFILPCTPTVTSDHSIGAEAIQVKVTVSETCSAVAYNSQELEQKVTDLLTRQAITKIGTGYSLFGDVQVSVKEATATHTTTPPVFLSFQAHGTWIYGLSYKAREHIKKLIAGKTKQSALHELLSLPGVERAFISWGDDTKLPKNSSYIHLILLVS
jgi:hypothetical protein